MRSWAALRAVTRLALEHPQRTMLRMSGRCADGPASSACIQTQEPRYLSGEDRGGVDDPALHVLLCSLAGLLLIIGKNVIRHNGVVWEMPRRYDNAINGPILFAAGRGGRASFITLLLFRMWRMPTAESWAT